MNLKEQIKSLLIDLRITEIIKLIQERGSKVYLVGGCVRDILMRDIFINNPEYNINIKDLDIEVHNISLEDLTKLLSKFGTVNLIGKSFGVLKIDNIPVDWSLPRTDSSGRRPEVKIDLNMDINLALKRRDLTMNAIAIDLDSCNIIDPYNGTEDIKNKILRAVDEKLFVEDPLRFFRVMQFISRFEFYPDNKLNSICSSMDLSTISQERIESEFEKMLLKSKRPSLGLRWLQKINRLKDIFPELYNTVNSKQEYKWHPEGDVFEHTMQALDAAARLNYKDNNQKLIILYAAICHDLGKPATTKMIDGALRSWGHEVEGVDIAKSFLKRITYKKDLTAAVLKLVRWHMAPGLFVKQETKIKSYKRLALNLSPEANIEMLTKLAIADRSGRNANSSEPLTESQPEIEEFLKRAQEVSVDLEKEKPILFGKDFLDIFPEGPELGKAVKLAYQIQIDDNISDKSELKKLVLSNLKIDFKRKI